jgi:hypothetical protein
MIKSESGIGLTAVCIVIRSILWKGGATVIESWFWSNSPICIAVYSVYIDLSINYFHFLTKHLLIWVTTRGFDDFFQHTEGGSPRVSGRMHMEIGRCGPRGLVLPVADGSGKGTERSIAICFDEEHCAACDCTALGLVDDVGKGLVEPDH